MAVSSPSVGAVVRSSTRTRNGWVPLVLVTVRVYVPDRVSRNGLLSLLELPVSNPSGPVSRGDVGTVRHHLETLAERSPQSVAAYVAMAHRTTERALAAGRPVLDNAFLTVPDVEAPHARFQGVIMPNSAPGGLASVELDALHD